MHGSRTENSLKPLILYILSWLYFAVRETSWTFCGATVRCIARENSLARRNLLVLRIGSMRRRSLPYFPSHGTHEDGPSKRKKQMMRRLAPRACTLLQRSPRDDFGVIDSAIRRVAQMRAASIARRSTQMSKSSLIGLMAAIGRARPAHRSLQACCATAASRRR